MLQFDFPQANLTYQKPKDWTDEECFELRVCKAAVEISKDKLCSSITSYWMPSKEDLEALNNGKGFYITLLCDVQPPMMVDTQFPEDLNIKGIEGIELEDLILLNWTLLKDGPFSERISNVPNPKLWKTNEVRFLMERNYNLFSVMNHYKNN